MERQGKNFGLDLVRATAIGAVLFSHTAPWWLGAGVGTDILAAWAGGTGVHLFFSLSGFLIGGIMLRTVAEAPGVGSVGRFWARRWLRTLPAYWVLVVGLNWYWSTGDWRSLLFLQNFFPRWSWAPMTPHTWSLVLEEWFYLLAPVGLAALSAVLPVGRRGVALPVLCGVLIGGSVVARGLVGPGPGLLGPEPLVTPVLRLDCAAWGMLAAWWVGRRAVPGGVAAGLLVLGLVLLGVMGRTWVLMFQPERLVGWGVQLWAGQWQNIYITVEEAAAAAVVLGCQRLLPRAARGVAGAVGFVAALAYALYLVHVPVIYMLRLWGVDDEAGSWVVRGEVAGAVLVAAVLMRGLVELPVLAVRDRLVRDRSPEAAPLLARAA